MIESVFIKVLPLSFSSQVEVTTITPDKTLKVAVFLGFLFTFIDKISPLSPINGETEDIPPHNSTTFFLFQSFDSARADNEGKVRISKIKSFFIFHRIIFLSDIVSIMFSTTKTIAFGFAVGLLVSSCSSEPKRNPNLEGSVQDFDVCVKKQKAKGLSTDKCWDMLWRWLVERH